MTRRPIVWHILPSFVLLIAVVVGALDWYATRRLEIFQTASVEKSLSNSALTLLAEIDADPAILTGGRINDMCRRMGNAASCRFTVVLPSGQVIGDSESDPATMENHGDRSEIREALARGVGIERHFSKTLNTRMMYFASVAASDGKPIAVVRTAVSLKSVEDAVRTARLEIRLAGLAALLAAVLVGFVLSRRIASPLSVVSRGAEAIGAGDLEGRLPSSRVAEIDVLAKTMNQMAEHLAERIETVSRQREGENALLSSMTEAALAVDTDKVLIRANRAAADMFHLDPERDVGRNILEVVRNADLLAVLDRALREQETVEGDIYLPDAELYLQAHGSALRSGDGRRIGAVVVISDVTRLRRLETIRKDFVANVSHELKTPITSIRGFAETLAGGSQVSEVDRARFLHIISDEAGRLQTLVEDLLTLSTIEHSEQKKSIELHPGFLCEVLERAVRIMEPSAAEKSIVVEVKCRGELRVKMDEQLIQMAVSNLVDNAIKYCPAGSKVTVSASIEGSEVAVRVIDNGPGIPAAHLSRLFERFYRVDKSRSRKLGSTGLGLAIVKHIAGIHSGRVAVESSEGQGSTFSIIIPSA